MYARKKSRRDAGEHGSLELSEVMPDRHICQIACQKDMPDRTRGSAYVSLCQNIFENICWIARINTGKDLLDTDARQNARRYRR